MLPALKYLRYCRLSVTLSLGLVCFQLPAQITTHQITTHPNTTQPVTTHPITTSSVTFEHFGEEQGINRYITCIFEDRQGYLWFGAGQEGLYRYNGYEFKHYEYIVGDTTSLPHNLVREILHEDRSGNLWLFGGGVIARYNRATDDFTWFTRNRRDLPWDTWAFIGSVEEDSAGIIWLGSYGNPANPQSGGLIRLDPLTGHLTYYQHDSVDASSLISNCVSNLLIDIEGVLWIGTCGKGVDRFVPASTNGTAHFEHYRHRMEDSTDFIRTTIRDMVDDGAGSLWLIEARRGLLRYSSERDQFIRYQLDSDPAHPANQISILEMDPGRRVWAGSREGLARYDPVADSFIQYRPDHLDPFSIPEGEVRDLDFCRDGSVWIIVSKNDLNHSLTRLDASTGRFQVYRYSRENTFGLSTPSLVSSLVDRTGTLWIATAGGGINKYDPGKRKFNSLYSNYLFSNDTLPDWIQALHLDGRDRLWIGTRGSGLFTYDRKTSTAHVHPYELSNPGTIKSRIIWSILEHPEGILWIGGDSGLNRLDTRTMESEHFWPDPKRRSYYGPNYIMDLCPDSRGNLWIATMHGGLVSFHIEGRTFSFHKKSKENPGGVHATGLISVAVDEHEMVWVGSLGGLHKYIPGNQERPSSTTYYYRNPLKPNFLGTDMVIEMIFDDAGQLWLATGGGGLNRLDIASEEFTHFTTREGLISNTITNLWMDGQGKLWLGSHNGLGLFDPLTESCTMYDRTDGLVSRAIEQNTGCMSKEGEIFLAGPGGINYFHPDSLRINKNIPPVVINTIELFDKPLIPAPGKKLELEYNENFLTFEFAALNYTNSHKNQYRYRMIGLDPDTVFAGIRRTASYTDMKPGNYTFWVTGSNNDGVWNPDGTTLNITIHPPWSRSMLAIFLYVILFVTGVLGIIRWRTWKLRNDRKILEQEVKQRTQVIEEKDRHILEMDRMKTRFFANISHEFRTPLSLIISPLDELMARRKQGDPELRKLGVIRRNSQRLLGLVNQLLDLAKLDSGKLKLELVKADVVRQLRLTCASFISLAEKNRIRYNFHLPKREYITYYDAGKLDTILINLLSNAFKYTPREGIIDCYARIEGPSGKPGEEQVPERLSFSVIDSGPGIDPLKQEHIFERFYQGDEEHQTEGGGTGIGLSLTKELVELVHGEITVNSEPGEGSCFMVTIPLDKEHLKESEYLIKEDAVSVESQLFDLTYKTQPLESLKDEDIESDVLPHTEPIHLLIVEDHDDLRLYLKEQLQASYTVLEADGGETGLKQALKHIPDLIISDVMMPGMDGMEFCQRLKTNERTSHIPVILLTAKADFDSKISGLELGADDYILKPFQIRELRTRVDNLIKQRNMLRERFGKNLQSLSEDLTLNSYDVKFIRRVSEVVQDHLSDFDFDVKKLQEKSGFSHTQLYRKLHALTGYSPSKFIRHLRLKRAVKLLEQDKTSITQVAFEVGFGNLSYFTKCFKEQFGIPPSEYSRQYK